MDYHCVDCSYRGKKFLSGACPACGSNNIRRINVTADDSPVPTAKPYRLITAMVLWLFFIVEVYRKLSL